MWNGEMLDAGAGLLQRKNRKISARIPHQSAARTSLADSFSRGEAILRREAALSPLAGRHTYNRKQQFTALILHFHSPGVDILYKIGTYNLWKTTIRYLFTDLS
jgi:hypothetical protein